MTNRTAARRYARALFDVAVKEEPHDLQRIETELLSFVRLLEEHPTLEKVLLNPVVPTLRKRALVGALTTKAAVAPALAKLLVLLAERDRLALLKDLRIAYGERLQDHRNVVRAEVTTAIALTTDRVSVVEQSLGRATGRTVAVSTRVDPSIIGGVVARVGSILYDGSVTRQLQKMKEKLAEGI